MSAVEERLDVQNSHAVHTWAGRGGARLVLTNHGVLIERQPASDEWHRVGLHVDGDEAEIIARRRGYDHVGLDSAEGYVSPMTLAIMETTTEGDGMSAGPQGSGGVNAWAEERSEAYRKRNEYIDQRLAKGDDLETVLRAAAKRSDVTEHSAMQAYVKWCREHGKASPWDDKRASQKAETEAILREIAERRAAGETLKAVSEDLAQRYGRSPAGIRQTVTTWQAKQQKASGNHLAVVPDGPQRPAAERVGGSAHEATTASAQVRSLLGVTVTADDSAHVVDQLHSLQADMVSAMRATLQAIPDAKRIIELQVEELMTRLDEIDAEGKRIQAAADALGVSLE